MTYKEFLGKNGPKFRVWIDEFRPNFVLSIEEKIVGFICAAGPKSQSRRIVIVEVFQPVGAAFQYGLLGGVYEPYAGGILSVLVSAAARKLSSPYENSLASSVDFVRLGGWDLYGGSVINGINSVSESIRPSGSLTIFCMACGDIGSSPFIFERMARTIVGTIGAEGDIDLSNNISAEIFDYFR